MDEFENYCHLPGAGLGRRNNSPSPSLAEQLSHSRLATRRKSTDDRYAIVGICAMAKKIQAAPMQSILARLRQQEYIKLVVFSDHTILNEPVEQWPLCNWLVAFYSKGFPLKKALDYVKLRGPVLINDLQMQYALMDRRKVYEILQRHGVDVPKYVVLNRPETESSPSSDTLIETDDTIAVEGCVFHKPFVEKPISAEDHTVHIYFPSDYGGGCRKLFRKVKDCSSTYSKQSTVRKTGSYIYQEFMPTDGTDVKVYTVGPDYAHAEARKSPVVDGKVERDEQGKEKRYPVSLTAKEKLIARQVCLAFKQTVCGFDLLRTNGKSYVCDVNGFSFVKNSHKYCEDCAQILLEMIRTSLTPDHVPHVPPSMEYIAKEVSIPTARTGNMVELHCVTSVTDQSPKQKAKMIVKCKKLFEEVDDCKTTLRLSDLEDNLPLVLVQRGQNTSNMPDTFNSVQGTILSNIHETSHATVQVQEQNEEEERDVSEHRHIEVNCLLHRGACYRTTSL